MAKKQAKAVADEKKIFVLDTSVILHNHSAITSFGEHDVVVPITVLEELDRFKKGHDNRNYEAREFVRIIEKLFKGRSFDEWIPLNKVGGGNFKFVLSENSKVDARKVFDSGKSDHRILNAALFMQETNPDKKVIMVTKDINFRLKASALGLQAEDFETGKIKDVDKLYTGITNINNASVDVIDKIYAEGGCTPKELKISDAIPNHYYIIKAGNSSVLAFYNPTSKLIERLDKRSCYKITPRNAEQVFALHAITNYDVKLVTIQGVAGTGKTLLALAGALEQRRQFKQIYLARPIVPLSNKDIGYLPGDIKSKLNPYMEPLWDNLKFIQHQFSDKDKEFQNITSALESEKLVISPLAYIRGRSLSDICFIVDEAQNLTPHEVKTIITRAGENTKIIFTGDIHQIDTPYLDSQSNGLSYLIDRIKKHPIYAHITLEKGERSELANLANELM